jgi:D-glycero-D-manno-heptose 1,7-bisphosphate phosphatase
LKAVFVDRDGVINELIYHSEQGIIDSPFTVAQLHLLPGVTEAIERLRDMGYKVIIVSNQPGIAKGHMSWDTFEEIRQRLAKELVQGKAYIDGEYYCFHHPEASVYEYRINCECRKPKPGLLIQAAKEMGIDLSSSWMIGDGLTDIQAGKNAGCRTILLSKMKCELCYYMEKENAVPDAICSDLSQAVLNVIARKEH